MELYTLLLVKTYTHLYKRGDCYEDIYEIVKIVRFDCWQDTASGRREVKKALRSVIAIKYKIKDTDVFDKAYSYIEMYY